MLLSAAFPACGSPSGGDAPSAADDDDDVADDDDDDDDDDGGDDDDDGGDDDDDDDDGADDDDDDDGDDDDDDGGDDDDDGGDDDDDDDDDADFDCDDQPDPPTSYEILSGPKASEDFVFDKDGRLLSIGGEDGGLYGAEHGSSATLLVPGIAGWGASGLQALSTGELVLADSDNNRLVKFDLTGAKETLLGGLSYPNGVTVDLDDNVYVAEHDAGRVHRVDTEAGTSTVVADGLTNPNGLSFDPTYSTLYIGSFGGGSVHAVDIAADGASSNLRVFADGLSSAGRDWGEGGGLDGLGVDRCGNVYVTEYIAAIIWRITPDGDASRMLDLSGDSQWIPNLHWGSGRGGWQRDHLYVMDREFDRVYDIALGIPGKKEPHL